MRWLDLLQRPNRRIGDVTALSVFIDRQAAFLAQKGIFEFARARAGHYAKVLFAEQPFLDAIETARWQAYPLGLAMVGEMVEGALREGAGAEREAVREGIIATVLAVFDRYRTSAPIGEPEWLNARQELNRRLAAVSLRPRKLVKDIPEQYASGYFGLIPIHESLRRHDFQTVRNYLKVTLCNIHDEFVRRVDASPLIASLCTVGRVRVGLLGRDQ
jgi:hypothetical protein